MQMIYLLLTALSLIHSITAQQTYAPWQFDSSLPPPLGTAQSLTTSSTTSTSSTTTTTSASAASETDTCTGWCTRTTSLTSDNITYIVTAACIAVLCVLIRHDKKALTLVLIWTANIYSYWFLSQYWLWNVLLVIDILTYRFLYPPGSDEKHMHSLLNPPKTDTVDNEATFEDEHYMKRMKAKQDRLDQKYMDELKHANETSEERATRKYIQRLKHKR